MGIFDFLGERYCHTEGCGNPREHGLRYCTACQVRKMDSWMESSASESRELDMRPKRPLTEELPAVKPSFTRLRRERPSAQDAETWTRTEEMTRRYAAPPFEHRLDLRCYFCCKMLNEAAYDISELVKPIERGFTCSRHYERYMAHVVIDGQMQEMRNKRGMSASQIEHHFTYGYLGEYLRTGEVSDYDGDHSDNDR